MSDPDWTDLLTRPGSFPKDWEADDDGEGESHDLFPRLDQTPRDRVGERIVYQHLTSSALSDDLDRLVSHRYQRTAADVLAHLHVEFFHEVVATDKTTTFH